MNDGVNAITLCILRTSFCVVLNCHIFLSVVTHHHLIVISLSKDS